MEKLTPYTIETASASMAAQHASAKRYFAWAVLAAAVIMIMLVALTATVGTTSAYFTTYASAKGSVPVTLTEQTTTEEDFSDWKKDLTVTNSASSREVYVRAKAFSGATYPLTYEGRNWSLNDEDGYYYYGPILKPSQSAEVLSVTISGVPDNVTIGDNFNVVLVYETTPVLYDENGNPYADWNNILDNGNIPEGGDQ